MITLLGVLLVLLASCGKKGSQGVQGVHGDEGQQGSNADTSLVEVCRDSDTEKYIETIIYSEGSYLAYLSSKDHKKSRLVILLEDVVYVTTDGRKKKFVIVNGEIICQ